MPWTAHPTSEQLPLVLPSTQSSVPTLPTSLMIPGLGLLEPGPVLMGAAPSTALCHSLVTHSPCGAHPEQHWHFTPLLPKPFSSPYIVLVEGKPLAAAVGFSHSARGEWQQQLWPHCHKPGNPGQEPPKPGAEGRMEIPTGCWGCCPVICPTQPK